MIRLVLFFVVVGLVAFGVHWLAERPGDIAITWFGWHVETSIMVAVAALAALCIAVIILWSIVRGIWRAPRQIAQALRRRRERRGLIALSRGLIAIGAGDADAARKHADEARRFATDEALTLLLGAQSAQLSGDREGAERAFRAMARRDDTKLLGLRGLYVEAQRHDDLQAARHYAEEAAQTAPSPPWAGQAVLQFRCAAGDWAGALAFLDRNRKSGAFDKTTYQRDRAVLLTAQALALEETERDRARELVLEAVKLAPDSVPAAALAGRFLAEAGELRKASRIVEKAWRTSPHPDLADVYTHLRFGDSARDRLARIEKLVAIHAGGIEGALALARAAIEAGEFARARAALAPHLSQPTQRVALLMAELEQAENGDEGRAREWTARAVRATRDPVWTADGIVSDRWMPFSPVSGRIGAFEWKTPLAEIAAGHGVVVEGEMSGGAAADARLPAEPPSAAPAVLERTPPGPSVAPAAMAAGAEVNAERPSEPSAEEPRSERAAGPVTRPAQELPAKEARVERAVPVEAVTPLIHAPDDPGPDIELEPEPQPEAPAANWRRLFSK
jgi:HemY protein